MTSTEAPLQSKAGSKRSRLRGACALLAVLLLALVAVTLAFRARTHQDAGPVHFGAMNVRVVGSDPTTSFKVVQASAPVVRSYHVVNVGAERQYVRLKITVVDAQGNEVDPAQVQAKAALAADSPWCERPEAEADGWYYYRTILDPAAETTDLSVSVVLADGAAAIGGTGDYQLMVSAQAVQSKNQAGQNAGHDETVDVLDVEGWPEEA